MKKISLAFAQLFVFLTVTLPAYAADGNTTVQPCPSSGTFSSLCNPSKYDINNIVRTVIAILLLAAVLVALGYLIWGGIKWILSGGDKSKVDSARSHIMGAIIGLVIALAAFFIISIVGKVFGIDIFNLTVPTFF